MGTRPPVPSPGTPQPTLIHTQPPFVAFKPDNVPPSQSIYLQLNDSITIKHLANTLFQVVTVNYRYLTPQGEIKEGAKNISPSTFVQLDTIPLGEAWLLSITIQPVSNPAIFGWVFAQIGIVRGNPAAVLVPIHAIIWSGYALTTTVNGWPGTPSKEISDGPGVVRSITGSAVAAGGEVLEAVPANRRWQLLSFSTTLATSAAAGVRNTSFIIDDGASIFYQLASSQAQNPSTTVHFNLVPGLPFSFDTLSHINIPAPTPTILRSGFRIETSTLGILAGDQYSLTQYSVLEWGSWN
jgi:hypothetical protein